MFGNQIKLFIFRSLISPSKIILFDKKYQAFDAVFHHQMKHPEVRQKYPTAGRIFSSLLGVSSGDDTLRRMLDSGAPPRARSGAPWVRKFGTLSIRENLVIT